MTQRIAIGIVALAMLLLPHGPFAEDECTAVIRGTLMQRNENEGKNKSMVLMDTYSEERCATIRLEMIVTEENDEGEQIEVRVPKRVKIHDSTPKMTKFNYKPGKGRRITAHRFEPTSCQICD